MEDIFRNGKQIPFIDFNTVKFFECAARTRDGGLVDFGVEGSQVLRVGIEGDGGSGIEVTDAKIVGVGEMEVEFVGGGAD